MSAVVSGVTAKLQDMLPGQIGQYKRYSTSFVGSVILGGYYATAERTESLTVTKTFPLEADTLIYDLPYDSATSFITVETVEFASDGTNIDGVLKPTTLRRLDKFSRNWRDDRGTRPEFYTLLSAPGIEETTTDAADGSKILIYRPMTSVDSEVIKVTGIGVGGTSTTLPEDIQYYCVVPYCLSVLLAKEEPGRARDYYDEFLSGCIRISGRYANKYTETPYVSEDL